MAKLEGREIMRLDGVTLQTPENKLPLSGTLVIREDGMAFYKVKGGRLATALLGGSPLLKGSTDAAPEFEIPYSAMEGVRSTGMKSTIFLDFKTSGTWLLSRMRSYDGRSLDYIGNYLNDMIRYPGTR